MCVEYGPLPHLPAFPRPAQPRGVSAPRTVARRALRRPWQGPATLPSRGEGLRAAPGRAAEAEAEAGPGGELGPARGAPGRDPAQRHLPLNIRILSTDAKVAVTLDSKSASCTPVLRKAPAEGLFSQ